MEYELQKIKEELKTKDGEVKILRAILKKNPEKQKLFELENELTEHNEMKEEIMVKNNEISILKNNLKRTEEQRITEVESFKNKLNNSEKHFHKALRKKDEIIENLEKEIDLKHFHKTSELLSQLTVQNSELNKTKKELNARDDEILALKSNLKPTENQRISEMQHLMDQLKNSEEILQNELKKKTEIIENLEKEIELKVFNKTAELSSRLKLQNLEHNEMKEKIMVNNNEISILKNNLKRTEEQRITEVEFLENKLKNSEEQFQKQLSEKNEIIENLEKEIELKADRHIKFQGNVEITLSNKQLELSVIKLSQTNESAIVTPLSSNIPTSLKLKQELTSQSGKKRRLTKNNSSFSLSDTEKENPAKCFKRRALGTISSSFKEKNALTSTNKSDLNLNSSMKENLLNFRLLNESNTDPQPATAPENTNKINEERQERSCIIF